MLIETRGNDGLRSDNIGLHQAILNPIASYNGLWSLKYIPKIDIDSIKNLSYNDLVKYVFDVLCADKNLLNDALLGYKTFDDLNTPLKFNKLDDNLFIQELYTGPTRAFKDMAMQPFGRMLCSLAKKESKRYLILTATSGDTGPATLEAIKDKPNIYAVCMYPNNGTSDIQKLQMTTNDAKNIKVLALNGDFDDAQNALKKMLNDHMFIDFLDKYNFSLSATNSVNFGRIIFQIIYHIYSYIYLLKNNFINNTESINIIVPSGNFGNALGAFYAKEMGVKINKIIIATNANSILFDFIKTGKYDIANRKLLKTNSPAMDILKSSNMERILFHLYGSSRTKILMEKLDKDKCYEISKDELDKLNLYFDAYKSSDDDVLSAINEYAQKNIIIDPHTATALLAYKNTGLKTIIISTAEWSKFPLTITKALGLDSITNDLEALNYISKKFSIPIHKNIESLFIKSETNKTIVDSNVISDVVKDWIKNI